MTHPIAASPSAGTRLLGLAGILGGAVLLAAFVAEIPPDLNNVRLVIFNLGAIGVVVAVHRRQVERGPMLAMGTAAAAVLANAWYLSMVVLATGRPNPFAGDFGLVFFYAALALWLADAAFGIVTLRLRVVAPWGPLALAIGSALALTGIDRLALTSVSNPTIFGPLALIGVALNGVAWILLGLDIVSGGRLAVPGRVGGVSRA